MDTAVLTSVLASAGAVVGDSSTDFYYWKTVWTRRYQNIYNTVKPKESRETFVKKCLGKRFVRTFCRPSKRDEIFALDMHRWFQEALDAGLWKNEDIIQFVKERYQEEYLAAGACEIIAYVLIIIMIILIFGLFGI